MSKEGTLIDVRPMTILESALVIDDVETDLFQAVQLLENQSVAGTIDTAPTGRAAMDRLAGRKDYPQLILLELSAPHLGGLAFLDWLDQQPDEITRATRVILLTGMLGQKPFLLRKAMEYPHVIGCIEKPLEANLLHELLEEGWPAPMASNY
ncbi:MAG: hypothetical protein FD123_1751 [Bacteroidetes bacterium]|nr:MAG: hypothetical protein FD123_1751 [Bacteroidota bacterium]